MSVKFPKRRTKTPAAQALKGAGQLAGAVSNSKTGDKKKAEGKKAPGWMRTAAKFSPPLAALVMFHDTATQATDLLKALVSKFNPFTAVQVTEEAIPAALSQVTPEVRKAVNQFLTEVSTAKASRQGGMNVTQFDTSMNRLDAALQKAMASAQDKAGSPAEAEAQQRAIHEAASWALLNTATKDSNFAALVAPWYSAMSKGVNAPQLSTSQVADLRGD